MKILFCGTHPNVATGYANVVYHFISRLKIYHQVVLFAFDAQAVSLDRAESLRVKIISPYRENQQRFGEDLLEKTLKNERPDLLIIYNDILVVSGLLRRIEYTNIPKWIYLDMVYEWQDINLIKEIMTLSDHLLVFTPFWKKHLLEIEPNYSKPIDVMYHGLKPKTNFTEVDIGLLRNKLFGNISHDAFIVLNLNRNTFRKRWDLTIQIFLSFLKKNQMPQDTYLFIGCKNKETYDLNHIIEVESRYLGLDVNEVKHHLIWKNNILSELEIDFLYHYCQVGLNTSNGEGFGLCNFEHASYGHPQIVGYVGGLIDCLRGAKYVYPIGRAHVAYEETRGIVYDYRLEDFVNALDLYYCHLDQRELDGKQLQQFVMGEQFNWDNIVNTLFPPSVREA